MKKGVKKKKKVVKSRSHDNDNCVVCVYNSKCGICSKPLRSPFIDSRLTIASCNHIFHETCFIALHDYTCPLCKNVEQFGYRDIFISRFVHA